MSIRPARLACLRLLAVLGAIALGPGQVRAGDPHWLDLESRIQYGYYTEDARALRNVAESLGAPDSHDRLKSYYVGLMAYRVTLLAEAQANSSERVPSHNRKRDSRKHDPSTVEARQEGERCVSALDEALRAQSDFADALALQSACLDLLAQVSSSWRTPFAAPKSEAQLHKALQLAPKNPRVLLLEALAAYDHEEAATRSCEKFKSTAAVFDTERADVDQVPGWGAAEAYMWLGRCYLEKGDVVPARDALERALLIAPEFVRARRLLSSITSG